MPKEIFPAISIVALDRIRCAAELRLSKEEWADMQATVREDMIANELVFMLTGYFARSPKEEVIEQIFRPDGWWQHVRARWFPGWWLARHPVKTERIVVTKRVYHVCPHLKLKDQRQCLAYLVGQKEVL